MQKSESITTLAAALVKAQGKIKSALKDSTNPHFRSKYADLSSVVEAVKAPLLECGITFLQGVHDAEGGVAVETMLLHTSGEWISSTLRLPATKQDAQGYGSAITYGRRYGLMSICGVPADDDDGNAASAPKKVFPEPIRPSDGAMDRVDPDRRNAILDTVTLIVEAMKESKVEDAYGYCESFSDADEKVALWALLDSKTRSTIKKHVESLKQKAA